MIILFGFLILIFKDYFKRCSFCRNQHHMSLGSSVGRNLILVPFCERAGQHIGKEGQRFEIIGSGVF